MKLFLLAFAALPLALSGAPAQLQIPAPEVDNGYLKLGFDRLSGYKFIAPEYDPLANPKGSPPTGEDQIPPALGGLEKSYSTLKVPAAVSSYSTPLWVGPPKNVVP